MKKVAAATLFSGLPRAPLRFFVCVCVTRLTWGRCRVSRHPPRTDGSAGYVDGTRRLPISPLIGTYLVLEALQSARSARHRLTAHHRP